jgi:Flp pilus assembly pilin Flp
VLLRVWTEQTGKLDVEYALLSAVVFAIVLVAGVYYFGHLLSEGIQDIGSSLEVPQQSPATDAPTTRTPLP